MEFITELKKRLAQKLPADLAHANLMNYNRKSAEEILLEKKNVRMSAVLCLLYEENGDWFIYLMERNSYDGVHSGQISFPGGQREKVDRSFQETALREAKEELNINPDSVEILGELSTMYIPPSNFLVYPFVGVSKKVQNIKPDKREVNQVVHARLSSLMKEDAISSSAIRMSGSDTKMKVKHYTVDGHIVWGATGMILAELVYLMHELDIKF